MREKTSLKTFGSAWDRLGDKLHVSFPTEPTERWLWESLLVAPMEGMCDRHSGGQRDGFKHRSPHVTVRSMASVDGSG